MELEQGFQAANTEDMLVNIEKGKEEMKRPASFKKRPANINPDGIKDKDNGLVY